MAKGKEPRKAKKVMKVIDKESSILDDKPKRKQNEKKNDRKKV